MTPGALPRVFLALGANLGDREAQMRDALRMLAERCRVVAVSSLYESPALVPQGEPPGPDYLNAVCEIETDLSPHDLLALTQAIERALGRAPSKRWAARPIDVDVLLYGDQIIETPELTIPHPAMNERNFVLAPLCDIAPDITHPKLHRTIADLNAQLLAHGLARVEDAAWAQQ
jgi:2-amino-4-hydroxy-6-hydroxymethyldihydropteridine diphosphokinase